MAIGNSAYKHYLYLHIEVSMQDVLISVFIFSYALDKDQAVCLNIM